MPCNTHEYVNDTARMRTGSHVIIRGVNASIHSIALSIPATSIPSERLFSKAGQLLSERRSRLKPKNVDKILFLNKFNV